MTLQPDRDELTRAVTLLIEPGHVVELRALGGRHGTLSGYFDDVAALVDAAVSVNGGAPGIYITLNPVTPALLARAANRVKSYAKATTADGDITARRWLLLDFDPIRPAGISSTDSEHDAAIAAARAGWTWLSRELGFPAQSLIAADSGNGAHLVVRVDLPNTPAATALVRRCLEAAALYLGTDTVAVDVTVFNAARIGKLYGTIAAKGDATSDRPHRLARILAAPDAMTPATRADLERLAALRPNDPPRTSRPRTDFDVRTWLVEAGIPVVREKPWTNGATVLELACCPLGDHGHHRNEAVVILLASGMVLFSCRHQTCTGRTWADLRTRFEPDYARRREQAHTATADAVPPAEDWPEPDRTILDAHALPPPALPLEVFSPPWRHWITTAAAAKSCAPDYVAMGLLSSASILLGNARWGAPWPGWSEPPILWVAAVGAPSSGKSPGLDASRTVLEALERDANAGRPERVRQYEATATMAALRRKVWEAACTQALRHGEPPPAQPDEATPPDRPRYVRLVTNDPTIERVARLVLENPKGVMVFRDELAGWLGNMDRYGGAGSDRAFYLEAYGGRRYAVDRVKDPEPIVVPALALVICGGIQPDRLQSLFLTGDDDGLVARFLWTWPERVAPRRPDHAVPGGASAALARLLAIPISDEKEHGAIPFTDAAAAIIQTYRTETATLEVDATGLYLSWLGKLPGVAVRLAVVLEHLGWCGSFGDFADCGTGVRSSIDPPTTVSERSAVAAVAFLASYAVPMAKRCFGEASWPQVDRDARTFGRWILAQHPVPDEVNLREVQRHHAPLGREAVRYAAAAGELILAGWLREPAVVSGRGRRAKTFLVNPRLRGAT